MKRLAILGSTGSIGQNALAVVAEHPREFEVVGLAAGRNIPVLAEQVKTVRPRLVSVQDEAGARALKACLNGQPPVEILVGGPGAVAVAAAPEADIVVSAMVGAVGLEPTMAAVEAGKIVALANKETLVAAGSLVMAAVAAHGASLIPVDSEHSAIFQALAGHRREEVRRLWLTASGGPFRTWPLDKLAAATPAQALKHPNWSMGAKITIDSATMMNKALEVIEASVLFGLPVSQIEVFVHPQSIIHSLVEFVDGSVLAQLGWPDMRLPIAYALTYPRRLPLNFEPLDLGKVSQLSFERPDFDALPVAAPGLRGRQDRGHHAGGAERRQRSGRGRLPGREPEFFRHPPGGGGHHGRPRHEPPDQPGPGAGGERLGPGHGPDPGGPGSPPKLTRFLN